MTRGNKPMPLSELPGYMRSARETGQGDDIPVVDMGVIVDDRPFLVRNRAMALAACVLLAVGGALFVSASTDSLVISSGADAKKVAEIVSNEGGSVFSVSQKEDGTYRVRVFSLRGPSSLLERLRSVEGVDSVDLGE